MGKRRITKPNKWFSCDSGMFVRNVYEAPDTYVLIRNHGVIFVTNSDEDEVFARLKENGFVIFVTNSDEDEVFARLKENGFVIFIVMNRRSHRSC